jgi:hypothetical protein
MAFNAGLAVKTGAAALALCLLAGNAIAAADCARPQDVTALQTAALQQQLMVAALACHDSASYNRFVNAHQSELQKSDRALMDFFLRRDAGKGLADYSTYKTRQANVASLRSLRDPQFCRGAKAAFEAVLKYDRPLAELVSERPPPIEASYESCAPQATDRTLMADAAPAPPERRQAAPDRAPTTPVIVRDWSARAERAPIPAPPRDSVIAQRDVQDGDAYDQDGDQDGDRDGARYADARDSDGQDSGVRESDVQDSARQDFNEPDARDDAGGYAPGYPPRYAEAPPPHAYDREQDASEQPGDSYDNGSAANDAPSAYRDPYRPHANWNRPYRRYAYARPMRWRQVRGPDGRWYLVPPYRRYFAER